jgi:dipeptidase E
LSGIKLAFIPTASNIEVGNKDWLIDDLGILRGLGFDIDIVDISAIDKDMFLGRLKDSKVLYFEGGNSQYLRLCIKESGLQDELKSLLFNRLWIGASAGSCVLCPTVVNHVQDLFDENIEDLPKNGLGLVDFQFVPHLNNPYFPKIRENKLKNARNNLKSIDGKKMYVVDDNGAVSVDDDTVKIVSEGISFIE